MNKKQNLIIVTSALNSRVGVVSEEQRLSQTIKSLQSIRSFFPEDFIVLSDGSPDEVSVEKLNKLKEYVDAIAVWTNDKDVNYYSQRGLKSQAESVLIIKTLMLIKEDETLSEVLKNTDRIFKISARTFLTENFDATEHYHEGKYVFKKKQKSWMNDGSFLHITRLYSLCPTLIDDYISTLEKIVATVQAYGVDTEHAHYRCLNEQKLVELDTIHCDGIVALNGNLEKY
jgi:hypothetical protein